MMKPRTWMCVVVGASLSLASAETGRAQINSTLSDQDRAEIRALSVIYRRALFGCKAAEYADLFATPGGYFGSSSRGEVRERDTLMEMVVSYDRCHTGASTPLST